VVQTQGPELVVATTHTHTPHSHVRGELGVGSLASHFIPAGSAAAAKTLSSCASTSLTGQINADNITKLKAMSSTTRRGLLLLLLTPVLLASAGCPALMQRITGDTCINEDKR
jgi:hypothetical protein